MHTSCIYLERMGFYLYMQPKIISKCITLMTPSVIEMKEEFKLESRVGYRV